MFALHLIKSNKTFLVISYPNEESAIQAGYLALAKGECDAFITAGLADDVQIAA